MGILGKPIFLLGLADGAILNGLSRAIADTGHAMGAGIAPDRLVIFQRNVVQRAQFFALTASDAFSCGVKILGRILEF